MVDDFILSEHPCYSLCKNKKYLACVGRGATVYNLEDLSQICHFGGMPNASRCYFLDEETLVVVSTNNHIYLYSIPEKTRLWTSREFANIRKYDVDGRFFVDRENREIYAILRGSYRSDGLAIAVRPYENAYSVQPLTLKPFPKRAFHDDIVKYPDGSVSFLHTGFIMGDNYEETNFSCIWRGTPPFDQPFNLVWSEAGLYGVDETMSYLLHSADFLIGYDDGRARGKPNRLICKNWHSGAAWKIALPTEDEQNGMIPRCSVQWLENGRYLCVFSSETMDILDFAENRTIARYKGDYLSCAEIIGDKLILGTWESALVYPFPFWMD